MSDILELLQNWMARQSEAAALEAVAGILEAVAGVYVTGLCLIGCGLVLAVTRQERR